MTLVIALLGGGGLVTLSIGLAALFGELTRGHSKLVFFMPWQVLAITAGAVVLICLLTFVGGQMARPDPASYRIAQRALVRIREHGAACVVISGNHDTPRLPGTGSPYSALADTFPEVHFAHRLAYERFELPLVRVLAKMEAAGIRIDREFLDTLSADLSKQCGSSGAVSHPGQT